MKKAISVLIMLTILISICVINVGAVSVDASANQSEIEAQVMAKVEKEFDKLTLEYQQKTGVVFDDFYYLDIWHYYCNFVDEDTIDYVYINWSTSGGSDAVCGARFLDYCIRCPQILSPTIGFYLYDVANEKVYTFEEAQVYARDYLQDFLDNHSDELAPRYKAFLCGDVDFDGELTVFDATKIQRFHAGLCGFSEYEAIGRYRDFKAIYVSDVDGDGERSVMDATAIQLKLAGLE